MTDRIRFHLDENVSNAIAVALRRMDIDVSTTAEASLLGQSDEAQLEFARLERRIIVTHDDDFLKIVSLNRNHFGIAYCRKDAKVIGDIVKQLALIYEVLTPNEMQGQVEFI
jgi:predicted nuclease of predicted toxin-antitoxin system